MGPPRDVMHAQHTVPTAINVVETVSGVVTSVYGSPGHARAETHTLKTE